MYRGKVRGGEGCRVPETSFEISTSGLAATTSAYLSLAVIIMHNEFKMVQGSIVN